MRLSHLTTSDIENGLDLSFLIFQRFLWEEVKGSAIKGLMGQQIIEPYKVSFANLITEQCGIIMYQFLLFLILISS